MSGDPLEAAVAKWLRAIPEVWTSVGDLKATDADERAVFALVAAGLVERRIGVKVGMGGRTAAISMELVVTGEYGLVEAMRHAEQRIREIWTRESRSMFGFWVRQLSFRVTRCAPDDWRLTHQGVIARADLAVEGRTAGEIAFVGCRQRAVQFTLRRGAHIGRPPVRGTGRVESIGESSAPSPCPRERKLLFWVAFTLRRRLVASVRKVFRSELDSALARQQADSARGPLGGAARTEQPEPEPVSLSKNQRIVLVALSKFDAREIVAIGEIIDAMEPCERLSESTVREAVNELIEDKLAERPQGDRRGARATTRGRLCATRLAQSRGSIRA